MQPSDIRLERQGEVTTLVTSGELDLSVAGRLADSIASAGAAPIVVSLVEATYVDSTILTVLIKATKADPGLVVLLPAAHRLRRIFEIANVNTILNVAATDDEARERALAGRAGRSN